MSSSSGLEQNLVDAIERGAEAIKSLADGGGTVRIEDAEPRARKRRKQENSDLPRGIANPSDVTWGVKTFRGSNEGVGLSYADAAELWTKLSQSGTDVYMTKEAK